MHWIFFIIQVLISGFDGCATIFASVQEWNCFFFCRGELKILWPEWISRIEAVVNIDWMVMIILLCSQDLLTFFDAVGLKTICKITNLHAFHRNDDNGRTQQSFFCALCFQAVLEHSLMCSAIEKWSSDTNWTWE